MATHGFKKIDVLPLDRIRRIDCHVHYVPKAIPNPLPLSREKIVGLDGVAGAGKTTTLAVIREGAEAQGYKVEGFAPTSRAAQKLADAGMETSTLQKHLARGQQPDTGERRLYVLDESSSCIHPTDARGLSIACIPMTVCYWWATGDSMRQSRPGVPSRSFRMRA